MTELHASFVSWVLFRFYASCMRALVGTLTFFIGFKHKCWVKSDCLHLKNNNETVFGFFKST